MRQSQVVHQLLSEPVTKVSNYGEEVFTLAFISGMQDTHPLSKHLLKHNVVKISEVLSQARPYIQFEEAMKASSNHSAKSDDGGGKSMLCMKLTTTLMIDIGGNLLTRGKHFRFSLQIHSETTSQWNFSLRWSSRSTRSSTLSKTNPGSGARDQSNTISHFPGRRNTVPTTTAKATKSSTIGPSEGTWRSSSSMTYSKSTSSLSK